MHSHELHAGQAGAAEGMSGEALSLHGHDDEHLHVVAGDGRGGSSEAASGHHRIISPGGQHE